MSETPEECEDHCFCIFTGDVDYVGEPFFSWGLVVECCRCDAATVIPNRQIDDDFAKEAH